MRSGAAKEAAAGGGRVPRSVNKAPTRYWPTAAYSHRDAIGDSAPGAALLRNQAAAKPHRAELGPLDASAGNNDVCLHAAQQERCILHSQSSQMSACCLDTRAPGSSPPRTRGLLPPRHGTLWPA